MPLNIVIYRHSDILTKSHTEILTYLGNTFIMNVMTPYFRYLFIHIFQLVILMKGQAKVTNPYMLRDKTQFLASILACMNVVIPENSEVKYTGDTL